MPHISEDLLDRYALKKLPESEVVALEEHLLLCSDCQDRLRLTEDFIEALRDVKRGKADGCDRLQRE